MASLYPGHVGAVQVGAYFLEQYYRILQQQPELVHQFYTDVSSMARFDGTATETATGMVLKEYSVRRKFVETFFLAPQEKGYFVLNDIFHLLEEEHIHQHPTVILAHSNLDTNLNAPSSVPETVSDYILEEQVQSRDLVPSLEENDAVEKYSIPEALQQLPESDERVDESPVEDAASYPSALDTARDPPLATPEEPVEEPTRQTYASILRSKGQSGQPMPHTTSLSKPSQVASEWAPPSLQPTSQRPQPALVSERSISEAAEEAPLVEDEGEARSVYVGNLSSSISVLDLEQVFKNFGRLRPDGVSIRSRKESDVFYAFIEYEDAIGVHNALKASPIQLNGRLIHVEGRRPNSGASRGKRGRGRGGYPSETSRGRFGGRMFGRGSRQDSNDRDYNSRTRGNGYPQRVQERGF
uniref:G3BP-like protein n=1 Tax=Musa acuminata subsp. malaccensis TaxID=214687 RepID=A0A804IXX2_MUSAM|nr:PREDICTED: putative G3BP-like protein isoform X2 [Musa acuminata subsp. malaccensis]